MFLPKIRSLSGKNSNNKPQNTVNEVEKAFSLHFQAFSFRSNLIFTMLRCRHVGKMLEK